ncbi:MAG: hypothetical protein WCL08_02135 [Verrucomicrobiota bacterium]
MNQPPEPLRKHWLSIFCAIIAIIAAVYLRRENEQPSAPETGTAPEIPVVTQTEPSISRPPETAPQSQAPSSITTAPQPTRLPIAAAPEVLALRSWLQRFNQLPPDQRETVLPEGIALAKARRSVMRDLIRSNPEAALQQAMRYDEWELLPTAIKAEVERPFSETVNYRLFPTCPGPGSELHTARTAQTTSIEIQFGSGELANGYVYGGKTALKSKEGLPTQGIELDGMAALRDGVFQALGAEETAIAVTKFPAGQPDPKRSFVTGEPVKGGAVTALAGGKLFTFADTEELLKFDAAIAKLDAKPGPAVGSRAIFSLPYSADAASGNVHAYGLNMIDPGIQAAAPEWTITPKNVFLIRVTLSGTSNASVPSKSEAETVLNGTVSDSILNFSYRKTSINATVSTGTYQLVLPASHYSGSPSAPVDAGTFTSANTDLLTAAKDKFRELQGSNGDEGINIGTLGAVSSGSYDIVGGDIRGYRDEKGRRQIFRFSEYRRERPLDSGKQFACRLCARDGPSLRFGSC